MGILQLIGEDESVAVAVVERIAQAVRATAYVEGRVPGSGVLMRGALLTNNHVLVGLQNDRPASPDDARNVVVRLNFQDAPDGTPLEPADVRLEPEQLLHASVDLDYALVGLDSSVNQAWGHVRLVGSGELDRGDDVFVIGHPDGRPKRISLADNEVLERADPWLRYSADTLAGSSGSPVFDRNFDFVALHHAAHHNASIGPYNEAVIGAAILADLPETVRTRFAREA